MNWTDQPVLITGGTGFVGGRLAERLAAAGARVRALVRRKGDHPGLAKVEQLEGDFIDPETARRGCEGMAIVIHAAASIGGDADDARRVNVAGTTGMAAAARAEGCRRFVHISTISVYDWEAARAARGHLSPDAEFDETTPLKAEDRAFAHSPAATPWYGITKAEAERALEREMALGLPATIFRLGAVLGAHPTSYWAVRVPTAIRAGQVPLVADGIGPLPWTHIENVGQAIDLAVENPAAIGRAYHVVDGHVTLGRYVEDVRAWFSDAPPAPRKDANPGGSFTERCSNERIRRELGYAPIRTYEEGMAEAAAWWRARE
ncbi:MAG TPA: NAD(P)-dependent oxidoreductase [Thermoanaerobaculia bacterium]|jgi:nucleoside-diphosphate-sugar epimerase|nr:NAD(P)-dependent oxidoreductase [Thermoanaerobaculia bacterium]